MVPILHDPQDGDTFDQFPRRTNLRWSAIEIPGVRHTLEVEAFGAVAGGKWAAEVSQSGLLMQGLTASAAEHEFVGAQRGRWRVRAHVGTPAAPWSQRYFRYTV